MIVLQLDVDSQRLVDAAIDAVARRDRPTTPGAVVEVLLAYATRCETAPAGHRTLVPRLRRLADAIGDALDQLPAGRAHCPSCGHPIVPAATRRPAAL